jgi:TPR repeat protein
MGGRHRDSPHAAAAEADRPDIPAGVEWLRNAADQGCARAQFNLAQQYACGNGEPRTAAETPAALIRKSAEAGWLEAQFALAERYRTGLGLQQDYLEAIRWYRRAADNSQESQPHTSKARLVLSLVTPAGELSRQDNLSDPKFFEVLKLYVKAVNLKDTNSAGKIAELYTAGRSVERNSTRANFWSQIATNHGLIPAGEQRTPPVEGSASQEARQFETWRNELRSFHYEP